MLKIQRNNLRGRLGVLPGIGFVLLGASTGLAQDAFVPPPAPPLLPGRDTLPINGSMEQSEGSVFFGRDFLNDLVSDPLRWGPFQLRPHASYQFTYGTGISRRRGEQQATGRHQISPGILFQGSRMLVDYTPTLNYYTTPRFEDHLDHNASFSTSAGLGDWRFSLSHTYRNTGSASIETASQFRREIHSTGLSAQYRYSDRTSFLFSLSQSIRLSETLNSSWQWDNMNWVNYELTEKVNVGVGVGAGYVKQDRGADMTYEQFQGRLGWHPGPKLGLNINGGVQVRQFLGEDLPDLVSPTMGASAYYQLFEQTSLNLAATRGIRTSFFSDRVTETTSVTAGVHQRLLGTLNFSISGGYRFSDYEATSEGVSADRQDDYTFVSTRLGTSILQKGRISVFYSHSENNSNESGFGFTSDQYGVQLSYRY